MAIYPKKIVTAIKDKESEVAYDNGYHTGWYDALAASIDAIIEMGENMDKLKMYLESRGPEKEKKQ